MMNPKNDPDMKKQEREDVVELGSDITRSEKGNIYTLTIIGQVEGHMMAPETVKTISDTVSCAELPAPFL